MKKFNFARIIVLVLSLALLVGAVFTIAASAEEKDSTGKFGNISLAYKDKVAIRVQVNATEEEILNGDVVVSYELNGKTANATYHETLDGKVWVITEGIAYYDLGQIVTFSSYVNGVQVESGRTYSAAQFFYKMLYTDSGITEKYRNLYVKSLELGEAAQKAHKINTDKLVTASTFVKAGQNISLNGKSTAFAPAASLEVTPVYNGQLSANQKLEGWVIDDNGEEKTVGLTFTCNGVVEILSPIIATEDVGKFTLANGGFENGLEGWTVVGNIGSVSSDANYWLNDPERAEGYAFGMEGEKMFSAYAPGALESAVGTLTSSTFTVGGSGWVTFKVGAMRDGNYVYVDVVDAETKTILARYYNGLWAERTEDVKSGCTLIAYKADLSEFMGKEVFFRISDNADSGYGLFFADSFNTYYGTEPEGFNVATPVNYTVSGTIYDLFNGGFEMGDVQGWWSNGEIGVVTNANGYWGDNIPYEKVGDFLFTGVESFGADTMREGNRGTLTSSAFEISGTGWISFKLGGGGSELCFVQIIDAVTGEILARYHQQAQRDAILIQYVADLSAYIGRTVRIQVVDQAESGWGCVSFDNVVTYYTSLADLPNGIVADNIYDDLKYTIDNGSFETGNLDGWSMNITEPGAHNTLGWVQSSEHDAGWYTKNDGRKDGSFLFTFCQPDGTNCENTKGNLESSRFSLKQGAFVSFKFGGAGTRDVCVELCRADGSVIARFFNEAPGKANTEMYSYYYQYNGPEINCFFRVVDNSTSNYGCFVVDDFRVNLQSAPEGYIPAIQ